MHGADELLVPDKIAPELGWRVWLVVEHEGDRLALHSAVQALVEWPVRKELVAECRRRPVTLLTISTPHDAPDEQCGTDGGHGCGIYGSATLEGCSGYLNGSYSPERVRGRRVVHRVYGRVSLWGKVLEADRGWRAQRAYPHDLWVPQLLRIATGFEIGRHRPPHLPVETIAAGLAAYGVPVYLAAESDELLAA